MFYSSQGHVARMDAFDSAGRVVGLHFAGSPSTSIFNKIGKVPDRLNIEVVTDDI
jgi:hypothetical protein